MYKISQAHKVDGEFIMFDEQTPQEEAQGLLETVMFNSDIVRESKLSDMRQSVQS
jgi:nicotinamide phosphoribosyltransferase